jgi:hypothetical protein
LLSPDDKKLASSKLNYTQLTDVSSISTTRQSVNCTMIYSISHCTIQHISLYYTAYLTVLYSISHCTIQHISLYYTVYLTVLHSISHCTIQYISLYYTVYLTVLYSISHCTIQYISLYYTVYLTGRFLYYFILSNFITIILIVAHISLHFLCKTTRDPAW